MGYTFITGATGGIGKAFSFECAKRGYDLYLTGRSKEKLASLKESLKKVNEKIDIKTYPCMLDKAEERDKLVADIRSQEIIVERIINVAGVDTQLTFTDYTKEKAEFQIRVNLESTVSLTHELLQLRGDRLELITISSMSGVTPMPYFALYSATKAALTSFFTSLRLEMKGKGVKCTTVLPGGVYTREDICKDIEGQGLWGKLSAKTPEYVAEKSLKAVKKNKAIYVPGFFNKFLYFTMKLVPTAIQMKFIAHRWKNITKDAF